MKSCLLASAFVFALLGCSSRIPFADAVPGTRFSVQGFETAIISEKIAFIEAQKRDSVAAETKESYLVSIRKYPTWSQWSKMKNKMKAGDEIVEFHHRLYASVFDGPAEADQHGYAIVRRGLVLDYIPVDDVFPLDYGKE